MLIVYNLNIKEIVFVPKQQNSYRMTVDNICKIKIKEGGNSTPIFLDVNSFLFVFYFKLWSLCDRFYLFIRGINN